MTDILFAVAEGVATITLNRPDVLNSFRRSMARELRETLARVGGDETVRAVVLTGAGRGFCAGQDLAEAAPKDGVMPDLGDIVRDSYNPVILAIRTLEKPVVCAVNGVAAGAGANLAFACDIVFASSGATFVQSFAKIGVIPDSGGTFLLPRLVGLHRANVMTMLAEKMTAEQARDWGLVYMVTEPENLFGLCSPSDRPGRSDHLDRPRHDREAALPHGRRRPEVIHVGYHPGQRRAGLLPACRGHRRCRADLALLADRLEGKLPSAGALFRCASRSWRALRTGGGRPLPADAAAHRARCAAGDAGGRHRLPRQRHVQDLVRPQLPHPRRQHAAARQRARDHGRRAALGHDGRDAPSGPRVLAVCGDGGFMMNSQELETAVRLRLNLVVLILHDDAYGMIRWKQAVDDFPDFGMTFGNPDFVNYAEAYGAKG